MKTRPAVPARILQGIALLLLAAAPPLGADVTLPVGGSVAAGSATIGRSGNTLSVATGSDRTVINWQGFSIGAGGTASFLQPGAGSVTLNRVTGGDVSAIYGALNSNGGLILVNPNGVLVGPGGVVNVRSFVASTHDIADGAFLAGGPLTFAGTSDASVVNLGNITATGRDIFLVARHVANGGALSAPHGTVGLAAGTQVTLAESGDQRVSVRYEAGARSGTGVDNTGTISALRAELKANGNIYSLAVNNAGLVQARGVANVGGQVWLTGTGGAVRDGGTVSASRGTLGGDIVVTGADVSLASTAVLDASGAAGGGTIKVGGGARGQDASVADAATTTIAAGAVLKADATDAGDGGSVVVWADDSTTFAGAISARGGPNGGNGGSAEVSGGSLLVTGLADLRAPRGTAGALLLDPGAVTIQHGTGTNAGANSFDDAYIVAQLGLTGSYTIATANASSGSESITIAASTDIEWSGASTLVLDAGNNIVMNTGALISNTGSGGVTFTAHGTGSGNYNGILINGATVRTASGAITMDGTAHGTQGRGVYLENSATVQTTGGGSISLTGQGSLTGTAANNEGVSITSGSLVEVQTGAGDITLNGTGGGGSNYNIGVNVTGIASTPSTVRLGAAATGQINITGTGSATATGTGNWGVLVENGSAYESLGAGSIVINGTAGVGTDSPGVVLQGSGTGGGSRIGSSSMTGSIDITSNSGARIESVTSIITQGSVSLTVDGNALTQTGGGSATGLVTASTLTLAGTATLGSTGLRLNTSAGTVQLSKSAGNVYLTNAGALTLTGNNNGAVLNVTAGGDLAYLATGSVVLPSGSVLKATGARVTLQADQLTNSAGSGLFNASRWTVYLPSPDALLTSGIGGDAQYSVSYPDDPAGSGNVLYYASAAPEVPVTPAPAADTATPSTPAAAAPSTPVFGTTVSLSTGASVPLPTPSLYPAPTASPPAPFVDVVNLALLGSSAGARPFSAAISATGTKVIAVEPRLAEGTLSKPFDGGLLPGSPSPLVSTARIQAGNPANDLLEGGARGNAAAGPGN